MTKLHPAYHEGYKDGYGHGHKDGKKGKEPKKLKSGGGVDDTREDKPGLSYTAEPNHVEEEAEGRRHGGRLKRRHGGKAEHEMRREHHAEGGEARARMDRVPRKRGGSVGGGSDRHPLSSASHVRPAEGRRNVDGDIEEGD